MYLKRRISIFLCVLLTFSAAFFAAPQQVSAAGTISFSGYGTYGTQELRVYKGAKNLYAGDFITAYDYQSSQNYGYLSMNSGVTYKSSVPAVAAVNSKDGKITAKKNGTTEITIKFKGQTVKYNLRVVSKDSMMKQISDYNKTRLSDMQEAAKLLLSSVGKSVKVTTANRYKLLTACASYDYAYDSGCQYIWENSSNNGNVTSTSYYAIFSPETAHARAVYSLGINYADERNPFGTVEAKAFVVKNISASGSSQKVNVTLKKKVTEEQLFGAQAFLNWNTEIKKIKTYSFPIYVQDRKTRCKYYAVATVQKGSDKMTIETRDLKLKKGRKYKLVSKYGSWLEESFNNPIFTAK